MPSRPEPKRHPSRSAVAPDALTASDLGLGGPTQTAPPETPAPTPIPAKEAELVWPEPPAEQPIIAAVIRLLADGYGGVVFRGPPGTSKTWYARKAADYLSSGDPKRQRIVQFHPSYQYEDFVEGYMAGAEGGFTLVNRHFVESCELAAACYPDPVVLVIDEFSRADSSRVFGEALTYLEMDMRDRPFRLASGRELTVPRNLVILGTMNEFDRGVDQVAEALERRLAFVSMEPDAEILAAMLIANGIDEASRALLLAFFQSLIKHQNRGCRIGHAYFRTVRDRESLVRLWEYQLRFVIERAFPPENRDGYEQIEAQFRAIIEKFGIVGSANSGKQ